MTSGWITLLSTALGGLLAIVGGILGTIYAARHQARLRRQEAEAAASEELIMIFNRLRSAYNLQSALTPDQRRDRRSVIEMEQEEGTINDEISRLAIRLSDKELRQTIAQFVRWRGSLEEGGDYAVLLQLLIERCGYVVRGEKRPLSMKPVQDAIGFHDPHSAYNKRIQAAHGRRPTQTEPVGDEPGLGFRQKDQASADEHPPELLDVGDDRRGEEGD
ncbi:hypothetical protein FXF51_02155 [Nonomuraea sp. PA05]|uniref:hypothetical protein n=1 Tax=Nonomuraea sp. PA05 TaxID=2604466 RepID=UPI0011DC6493|nr:hypothetical protein [Nonomuraea sp. PA05]TYB71260.1 hypothetical protein FXF51_02155 [Nonomuraea sp. PA05]